MAYLQSRPSQQVQISDMDTAQKAFARDTVCDLQKQLSQHR